LLFLEITKFHSSVKPAGTGSYASPTPQYAPDILVGSSVRFLLISLGCRLSKTNFLLALS
jgi:hypothetical protein